MSNFLNNDKNLVIISVLTLCLALIYSRPLSQAELTIISSAMSGLFGLAVGRNSVSAGSTNVGSVK